MSGEALVVLNLESPLSRARKDEDLTAEQIMEQSEQRLIRYKKRFGESYRKRVAEVERLRTFMSTEDKLVLGEVSGFFVRNNFLPRSMLRDLKVLQNRYGGEEEHGE